MVSKIYIYLIATLVIVSCTQSVQYSTPVPAITGVSPQVIQVTSDPTDTEFVFPEMAPQPGLVFVQNCKSDCGKNLWITAAQGKSIQIPIDGDNLSISNNNRFVAYEKELDIWLLDLQSGDQKPVTSTEKCWERDPFWSPDDKLLSFFGCGNDQLDDVFVFDIEKEELTNLSKTLDIHETCIDIYPGKCISNWQMPNFMIIGSRRNEVHQNASLQAQCHTENGNCSLFPTILFINNQKQDFIDQVSGVLTPPAISPDKQLIAYDGGHIYDIKTKTNITLFPVNNSDSPLLTEIPVHEDGPELINPRWSPDGKQIAWISHIGKAGDIGVIVFDLEMNSSKIFYVYSPGAYMGALPAWDRWPDFL